MGRSGDACVGQVSVARSDFNAKLTTNIMKKVKKITKPRGCQQVL